jgi:DNA-directed RNA polymerase specialized sigma subunit
MKAKEYLSQAYQIDNRINSKLEQIHSLRELATRATSVVPQRQSVRNRNVHRLEDIVEKIIDFECEINKDIDELVELKREIDCVIKRVTSLEERTVLEMRYLSLLPWEQIAVKLGFSLRNVQYIHGRALSEVEKTLH